MNLDRRHMFTGALATLGLVAGTQGCREVFTAPDAPGRGWIVSADGEPVASKLTGKAVVGTDRPFDGNAPFRIASITKLIVAMACQDWADAGRLDLDAPIGSIFPLAPQDMTLANLLSHQSGLHDPDVYWASAKDDILDLFSKSDFTHPPGNFFRYANLNYGLAASVVEKQLGRRFDWLIRKWLESHNIDAGLNWSGVSPEKRKAAAAIYRMKGAWTPTVDSPDQIPMEGPLYLGRERWSLSNYQPGKNGTLFSPQGGMRMSLSDLIRVGELLHTRTKFHTANWSYNGKNGETEDNHFLSFGPGSYVYSSEQSPIKGIPLAGHLGEAYGAYTGVFIVPDTNISFAFAQLGTFRKGLSMSGTMPNQSVEHQAFFDALAPIVRAHI